MFCPYLPNCCNLYVDTFASGGTHRVDVALHSMTSSASTAVTRTERQDRDSQRSNTSSAASGAATAGGYPTVPVLAPGEVLFRDPRVSRYSKNSSIVTNVGDFVVSVFSMVSLLSRKYVLVSGRTICPAGSRSLAIAIPHLKKTARMPGCPGQGLAEEGRARLARSILNIYAHF